jgi:hypothetical protein
LGVGRSRECPIEHLLIHERFKFQVRAEAFNMLDRHRFNNPNTNPTNTLFGQVTGAGGTPRNVQLGLRIYF